MLEESLLRQKTPWMSDLEESPELRWLCLGGREMSPFVILQSGRVVCLFILHRCSSDFRHQWIPRKWKNWEDMEPNNKYQLRDQFSSSGIIHGALTCNLWKKSLYLCRKSRSWTSQELKKWDMLDEKGKNMNVLSSAKEKKWEGI